MDKILIIDDNPAVLQSLSLLFELHDYQVALASSPFEAEQIVRYQRIDLAIQDMNFSADTTSGEEGKALFYQLRAINPNLPIILLTAWTELEMAISLVKAGAADYLAKPWDDEKLLTSVANLIALGKANQDSQQLHRQEQERADFNANAQLCGLIYKSVAMQRAVEMALQVAKSDVSVLITGANGSGKEKVAEIIQANSRLANQPFIRVNAGALPDSLIEAELFGAEAGAYTGANKQRIGRFEAADGGTLFLDEIGNLPLSGQMKLLRVLQTGEFERLGSVETRKVNVRVISATNAQLLNDIAAGRFREDLYYRLNVIEINLPNLKQRTDDIVPLVHHFLPDRVLSLSAEKALCAHSWPGNVRELENACKRAGVLKPQGELDAMDFGLSQVQTQTMQTHNHEPTKQELQQAMHQCEGVIAKVARQFGMSRQALYRRLQKHGIDY
ncbi:sigma-54-dependent transcriptional regulator [Pseudoalteromonas luteoviolacea]|uniref:Histidine kinase n=1 Tax=Pseudoalteromonas luteoviolacea S4054 TaxID=1129367 RepID=A0A0F6A829_9GAMM|nr:sigma-54 dependent transcriptional regulator [Pseudoalteromonas luteoviolacea]AOT07805.1 sigma-54-dependent Fis family transcriptional regulator [Pseudoalteromonas luteoviolacea]AOT12721.1 sigma-54-dependent Fis family transcriptional regulator [Pseudoalteromonas luteoviolacea]AOT17634.1 sigma-54-dependent Fis family transcriptional regulator [Pseudoalteromonas luteoviolacea]KKE82293.1 histidine kinase [Pseudoalteromonas luteoviolacea S4054]KZN78945.1 histidine kinase [Pseudoalteromonas lut